MRLYYDAVIVLTVIGLAFLFSALEFEGLYILMLGIMVMFTIGFVMRLRLLVGSMYMWVRTYYPIHASVEMFLLKSGEPYNRFTHHLDGASYITTEMELIQDKATSPGIFIYDQGIKLTPCYIRVRVADAKLIRYKFDSTKTKQVFSNGFGLTILVRKSDVIKALVSGDYTHTKPAWYRYWGLHALTVILAGYLTTGSGTYDEYYQNTST